MYRVQNSLSISIYHDRINIYWDMGLQKYMTLKRTKLSKEPYIKILLQSKSPTVSYQTISSHLHFVGIKLFICLISICTQSLNESELI